MGALTATERELKPRHKRTMGVNTAGELIEDPEEFCMAFGEDQQYFNQMMGIISKATEEEKDQLYNLLQCNQMNGQTSVFNSKGDLAQFMSTLTEDDYERIVEGL